MNSGYDTAHSRYRGGAYAHRRSDDNSHTRSERLYMILSGGNPDTKPGHAYQAAEIL